MSSRERVRAAYEFRSPDKVPVEYLYTPVGFYEHGEKLNDLFAAYPGDFEAYAHHPIPVLGPECFDKDGLYYEKKQDEWGTVWEYRIFGIAGIECEFPLDDWGKLPDYQLPPLAPWVTDSDAFEAEMAAVKQQQQQFHCRRGGFGFFQQLISLRPFEDILCDMITDDPNLIELMDRITDYYERHIQALIRMGVDSIHFGDDYGTQNNLIFSRDLFRAHFKPRYERLMKQINEAGIKVHFHSCGKIDELFPEFKEMGVDSVWPQLPAYDMTHLADLLRDLRLAIAIHTDRANTMTHGKPDDVRALVQKEYDIFRPDKGGAWFYIEVDNGMPFENVQALTEQIFSYR